MIFKKLLSMTAVSMMAAGLLAGCSSDSTSGSLSNADSSKVRTVKVAYELGSKPTTYSDDKGKPAGYDIEMMKKIDKLLPNYQFQYIGTSSDDLLIGVEQGKYDVGVKGAFYTDERAKKFLFPKEFMGLSKAGLVLKKENANIESLEDFATADLSLAPIATNNGQYTVIQEYNDDHPATKLKLKASDTFAIDIVQWVNEGRADGGVMMEGAFNSQVVDKGSPYHNLSKDVVFNEFAVIKTWPLYNKKEQDFADAYDTAAKKLKDDGTAAQLIKEYTGSDLFEFSD
ncbi:transporter substrate-binding domain-containing protein [Peribacillus sp. NPDC058002]|uniref:transporter substrate-binding domain-containing protein n=1 Tax=Peribacillus sp. NPDC058002 TaxID=3346301 RepID=UPI0036DA2C0E